VSGRARIASAPLLALVLLLLAPIGYAQPEPSGALTLATQAFTPGGPWSWRYTCYNALEPSPPLSWSGVPSNTGSLAVLLDAPEKPNGIEVHWLIYNLPPDLTGLTENVPKTESLDNGAEQARNDFGHIGFSAPCPPLLTSFTYRFTLYALDAPVDLPPATDSNAFAPAILDHVLASVQIEGTYLRPAWPWG
jgi:Raf kinase inhibitor-like YbhB/YbcL family protein